MAHTPRRRKVQPVAREIVTTPDGEEVIIDATVQAFDSPGGFSIGAVLSLDRITEGMIQDEGDNGSQNLDS